jgi:hypothetical protein
MRNAYKILFRIPERKRTVGILRYRWYDSTEMGVESGICGCGQNSTGKG